MTSTGKNNADQMIRLNLTVSARSELSSRAAETGLTVEEIAADLLCKAVCRGDATPLFGENLTSPKRENAKQTHKQYKND
jgi:hypothetical protein